MYFQYFMKFKLFKLLEYQKIYKCIHIRVCMATKTISITEEAYKLLVRRRLREQESFSQVISREFNGKERLRELFGLLKGKSGEEFKKNIEKNRRTREKADQEKKESIKKYFD